MAIKRGSETFPGYNQPKRTPGHPKKSHAVLAKSGDQVKLIRFGQQGVSGSPEKQGESETYKNRRESFKARHASNIAKGKMSAAYWADKVKWTIAPIGVMFLLNAGATDAEWKPKGPNYVSSMWGDTLSEG